MATDDSLNDGKPDSRPFKFLGGVHPLENSEQFLRVLHVKAGAVVSDKIGILCAFPPETDFDERVLLLTGEFDGVRQQIDEDLSEQRLVANTIGQFTKLNL